MIIEMEKLRYLCEILIKKTEYLGIQEIQLDTDNYWIITSDNREDFSTNSPEVSVGSLQDDWEQLVKILSGEHPPTPVDFDRIASIFVAVGESISKSDVAFY
jgi:hypothetical protein